MKTNHITYHISESYHIIIKSNHIQIIIVIVLLKNWVANWINENLRRGIAVFFRPWFGCLVQPQKLGAAMGKKVAAWLSAEGHGLAVSRRLSLAVSRRQTLDSTPGFQPKHSRLPQFRSIPCHLFGQFSHHSSGLHLPDGCTASHTKTHQEPARACQTMRPWLSKEMGDSCTYQFTFESEIRKTWKANGKRITQFST